jgi:Rieske Fe-S protein
MTSLWLADRIESATAAGTFDDADRAWECPLHGSRFDVDGEVLEGPATRGLSNQHR